jgi:hypothetical protein
MRMLLHPESTMETMRVVFLMLSSPSSSSQGSGAITNDRDVWVVLLRTRPPQPPFVGRRSNRTPRARAGTFSCFSDGRLRFGGTYTTRQEG